uniref:NADH dehydrogenase subunit 6 n=1 Tax=Blattisocius tarsalis TaxID=1609195 RepID=A0A6B9WFZ2_9ACAR|nr:NADH dehydrogenase subunit 6 [Blattisocius tarsalis]QHQ98567.1 NADH dehydrogenase subunit 6 [Blattisocius tarsalis]
MLFMKMWFFTSWYMFITTNQPMKKIMFLTMTMILMLNLLSFYLKSTWFPILYYLLMISGLLTLFMYMSSINLYFQKHLSLSYIAYTIMFFLTMKFCLIKNITNQSTPMLENPYLNIFHNLFNCTWTIILTTLLLIQMIIFMELLTNFHSPIRSNY